MQAAWTHKGEAEPAPKGEGTAVSPYDYVTCGETSRKSAAASDQPGLERD